MQAITHAISGDRMDVIKVFVAGIIAFCIDYLYWVPDSLKFVILLATTVYVVVKMMREIRRYYDNVDTKKD